MAENQLTPDQQIELLQQENIALKEEVENLRIAAEEANRLVGDNVKLQDKVNELESALSTANATIEELASTEGAKVTAAAKQAGATEFTHNGKLYAIGVKQVRIPKIGLVNAADLQDNEAARTYLVEKNSPLIVPVVAAE